MNIDRLLRGDIERELFQGKTIVVTGPRQTGKTTLVTTILDEMNEPHAFIDGDDMDMRQLLERANTERLRQIIGDNRVVFIDEAQRIAQVGLKAKIIHDRFKHVQLILSGSSSLDLNNAVNEPLTGRKLEYHLYPVSWQELEQDMGFIKAGQQLHTRLVYGMYPDVITRVGKEERTLKQLANSFLYKDILALADIRKPEVLERLLQALAYQLGAEVSFNELSQLLGVNKETVGSYIRLLEKAFVIFRLPPLSRNLRNEIKTNRKVYFYDNGIRNALINAFGDIELRNDKGALWENFLISERIKHLHYRHINCNTYFWRTKQQQEVDWVEERNQQVSGYEFKWKDNGNVRFPEKFVQGYSARTKVIDRENFRDFVMG
jgi:predicted AAA+ superfamily ATPase